MSVTVTSSSCTNAFISSTVCSLSTRKTKNYLVTGPARNGHCSRVPRTTIVRGRAPVSRVACCTCCCCCRCCCGRCGSLRRSVRRTFRCARCSWRAGRENPSSESSHPPSMVHSVGNATRRFVCCLHHSVGLVTAAPVASSVTGDCVLVAAAYVGACCIDAICRSSLHMRSRMLELSSSLGVHFGRLQNAQVCTRCQIKRLRPLSPAKCLRTQSCTLSWQVDDCPFSLNGWRSSAISRLWHRESRPHCRTA